MRGCLLGVVLAGGCYDPTFQDLRCGPGGACPAGLACVEGRCMAGCREDDECESLACLEVGACANGHDVIHAAPMGLDPPCGESRGAACSLQSALAMVQGNRNIVRLHPEMYDLSSTLNIVTAPTTLVARGSTLKRGPTGPVVSVEAGQRVKIIGGKLVGDGNGADGVICTNARVEIYEVTISNMSGVGLRSEGCAIVVSRSKIAFNTAGGIAMGSSAQPVQITNSLIVRNGQPDLDSGGLELNVDPSRSVFAFNTVADNRSSSSGGAGIDCIGTGFVGDNNLVTRNSGGVDMTTEVAGDCTIRGYTTHTEPAENVPGWVGGGDYHLTGSSPAEIRDAADCNGTTIDFEGDRRPAGDRCDLGADEYVP